MSTTICVPDGPSHRDMRDCGCGVPGDPDPECLDCHGNGKVDCGEIFEDEINLTHSNTILLLERLGVQDARGNGGRIGSDQFPTIRARIAQIQSELPVSTESAFTRNLDRFLRMMATAERLKTDIHWG